MSRSYNDTKQTPGLRGPLWQTGSWVVYSNSKQGVR